MVGVKQTVRDCAILYSAGSQSSVARCFVILVRCSKSFDNVPGKECVSLLLYKTYFDWPTQRESNGLSNQKTLLIRRSSRTRCKLVMGRTTPVRIEERLLTIVPIEK